MLNKLWILALLTIGLSAHGSVGLFLSKTDGEISQHYSKVVYVRDGNKNAVTLFSDYQGTPEDFAILVPVPEVITPEQIHIGERESLDRIDAFSAPRLIEFHDPNPCATKQPSLSRLLNQQKTSAVNVESRYLIGEYDILILSANDSHDLETWLRNNEYKVPAGASAILTSYVKQGLKFFVAKVNLKEKSKNGPRFLRPIQFAFESKRFVLPVRLGLGVGREQDLSLFLITRRGRVESANYKTVELPTGMDVPASVKPRLNEFYNAMIEKEERNTFLLEYAGPLSSCDPCVASPLTSQELRRLGVFWLDESSEFSPVSIRPGIIFPAMDGNSPFLTRLHIRYDSSHVTEDPIFRETSNTQTFQARYIARQAWPSETSCKEAVKYRTDLKSRREQEDRALAKLTGWKESQSNSSPETKNDSSKKWYQNIFN